MATQPTELSVIGFDGDDTLWHNESIFSVTQEKFRRLLRPYVDEQTLSNALLATEMRNLAVFGYGVKGFTLSMIETAIEVSKGAIPADQIQVLVDYGKEMLAHPVELLDGVAETVRSLSQRFQLVLITKGDLFDQESKIARSGLGDLFWKLEIVSEKDEAAYRRILAAHGIQPEEFVMVGNSMRSDILPVLEIGARAVYVPYHLLWAHEHVDIDLNGHERFRAVQSLAQLPAALANMH